MTSLHKNPPNSNSYHPTPPSPPAPNFSNYEHVALDDVIDEAATAAPRNESLRLPQHLAGYVCDVCDQGDHLVIDAQHALARNAAAHARPLQKPPLVEPRMPPLPTVPAAIRAQYQVELKKRVQAKLAAGQARAEAEAEAFDDLGCVEFWDWMNQKRAAEAKGVA